MRSSGIKKGGKNPFHTYSEARSMVRICNGFWYWKRDAQFFFVRNTRIVLGMCVCVLRNGKDQREYVNVMSEKERKTNDDRLRLSHINRYSNCIFPALVFTFNENVAFNSAWTALTLKPHKSTCDISTCVLEYSVWSWCDTCLPLFIYWCSVAFWTRPNLLNTHAAVAAVVTIATAMLLSTDSIYLNNGVNEYTSQFGWYGQTKIGLNVWIEKLLHCGRQSI